MSVSTVIDIEDTSVLEARSPCGSHHIKDGSRFFARVAEVNGRKSRPLTRCRVDGCSERVLREILRMFRSMRARDRLARCRASSWRLYDRHIPSNSTT